MNLDSVCNASPQALAGISREEFNEIVKTIAEKEGHGAALLACDRYIDACEIVAAPERHDESYGNTDFERWILDELRKRDPEVADKAERIDKPLALPPPRTPMLPVATGKLGPYLARERENARRFLQKKDYAADAVEKIIGSVTWTAPKAQRRRQLGAAMRAHKRAAERAARLTAAGKDHLLIEDSCERRRATWRISKRTTRAKTAKPESRPARHRCTIPALPLGAALARAMLAALRALPANHPQRCQWDDDDLKHLVRFYFKFEGYRRVNGDVPSHMTMAELMRYDEGQADNGKKRAVNKRKSIEKLFARTGAWSTLTGASTTLH